MIAAEYWTLCNGHDWYYNFADDHAAWKRGEQQRLALIALAADNPEFQAIFDAFQTHKLSGPAFGTPREPKPSYPGVQTFPGPQVPANPNQLELSV